MMGASAIRFGPLMAPFCQPAADAHELDRGLSRNGHARYPQRTIVRLRDNASPPETWPFHVLRSVALFGSGADREAI